MTSVGVVEAMAVGVVAVEAIAEAAAGAATVAVAAGEAVQAIAAAAAAEVADVKCSVTASLGLHSDADAPSFRAEIYSASSPSAAPDGSAI